MKIELDMHTHTIASGHAFSTLQEMARAGAEEGSKAFGNYSCGTYFWHPRNL